MSSFGRKINLKESCKKNETVIRRYAEPKGILVYGAGAHLTDMLEWYPDLKDNIARVFDKDDKRLGQKIPGTDCNIESPEALKSIAPGTKIAISAIRYYEEIAKEIYALNPGLICLDIDEVYADISIGKLVVREESPPVRYQTEPVVKVQHEHSEQYIQRIRGREATERWRRRFLIESANMRKVFWGVQGVRANFLIREFGPFMGREDIFIDDDVNFSGMVKSGMPICLPEVLKDIDARFKIIVLSHEYMRISVKLKDYGYIENVDFVEGRRLLGEDENGFFDVFSVDNNNTFMT